MSAARISVVIPVFDGERFLREALASVHAQTTRSAVEVIAVDDGSRDRSLEVLAGWPQVRVLRRPHQGVAAARNAGVAACSGELVAFLDQDDRFTADKLEVQAEHLGAHPELGFCLAHQRLFLEPGCEPPSWLKPELLEREQIGYLPGTLVVRREVLAAVGPFDVARPIASDSDWFLRAKDAGVRMAVLPQVLLERRIHRANQSAQTGQGTRELLEVVRASILRQRRGAAGDGG